MAKELPYFKFEPGRWDTGRIQMCSHEAKGVFVDLCSMYWQRLGDLPYKLAVQKICGGNATALDSLCDEKIIALEDGKIRIEFLDEQLGEFDDLSKKNSGNARSGWEKRRKNAKEMRPHSDRNAIREEKIREEERIIPPIIPQGGKPGHVVEEFKESVYEAGKEIYTPEMLERFIAYWTEPIVRGRHKGKYRYEGEETWQIKNRLSNWASRNLDGMVCFLADVKGINNKKLEFAERMRQFIEKYPRDHMNSFFRYWAQPENTKNPKFLKWEKEETWDMGMRMAEWSQRETKREAEKLAQNQSGPEKVPTYRSPDNLVT